MTVSFIAPMTATGSLRERLDLVRSRLRDHRANKYITYAEAARRYVANRGLSYRLIGFDQARSERKKSDTVFILGSGPSLNDLSPEQIAEIRRHDVYGISFSFLKAELPHTYLHFSWEPDEPVFRRVSEEALARHRHLLRGTLFFNHDKALLRLGHPRLLPEFYGDSPTVCFYAIPRTVHVPYGGDFKDEDFDQSLLYRGSGTLAVDLTVRLGYRRVVLTGFDPQTNRHFFDGHPVMRPYCDRYYERCRERGVSSFEAMVPKPNKAKPIDAYFRSAADYLRRRRGVELMTATAASTLHPDLPAYFPCRDA